MNQRELKKLKKWADALTDKELEKEYYDTVYSCLGGQREEMYERGYDIVDILKRESMKKN